MISVAVSRIAHGYFQLPVADADALYRERVYCYELYHQLRCLWETSGSVLVVRWNRIRWNLALSRIR